MKRYLLFSGKGRYQPRDGEFVGVWFRTKKEAVKRAGTLAAGRWWTITDLEEYKLVATNVPELAKKAEDDHQRERQHREQWGW